MRIGVMCSGGDAPGMNPCIRAVVPTALAAGHEVIGIRHGYQGMLDADFHIHRGETGKMAGVVNRQTVLTPFEQAIEGHKAVPGELTELLEILASQPPIGVSGS